MLFDNLELTSKHEPFHPAMTDREIGLVISPDIFEEPLPPSEPNPIRYKKSLAAVLQHERHQRTYFDLKSLYLARIIESNRLRRDEAKAYELAGMTAEGTAWREYYDDFQRAGLAFKNRVDSSICCLFALDASQSRLGPVACLHRREAVQNFGAYDAAQIEGMLQRAQTEHFASFDAPTDRYVFHSMEGGWLGLTRQSDGACVECAPGDLWYRSPMQPDAPAFSDLLEALALLILYPDDPAFVSAMTSRLELGMSLLGPEPGNAIRFFGVTVDFNGKALWRETGRQVAQRPPFTSALL